MTQQEDPLDDDTDIRGLTDALFGGGKAASEESDHERLATDSLDDLRDQELDDDDEDGDAELGSLIGSDVGFDDPIDVDLDDEDDDYASGDEDDLFDSIGAVEEDDDWD